ncbi:hypothetical protein PPERSA_08120 [Pseudocohnilembus persalinus]|uniref:Calpain catalytic domain-containing protein n=1 Tax=Pseudocohnilembus persalinus TaxID=266149 RepID=A0A0V0QM56_PSEPJ|nr:hypothetical protein PPERSA_08120 [Pseudocohnilembus persalinus]|eukprot:KRX03045.1 hypothetical protein PPERSA_08120 [Pseudocohnilembus persalinus]
MSSKTYKPEEYKKTQKSRYNPGISPNQQNGSDALKNSQNEKKDGKIDNRKYDNNIKSSYRKLETDKIPEGYRVVEAPPNQEEIIKSLKQSQVNQGTSLDNNTKAYNENEYKKRQEQGDENSKKSEQNSPNSYSYQYKQQNSQRATSSTYQYNKNQYQQYQKQGSKVSMDSKNQIISKNKFENENDDDYIPPPKSKSIRNSQQVQKVQQQAQTQQQQNVYYEYKSNISSNNVKNNNNINNQHIQPRQIQSINTISEKNESAFNSIKDNSTQQQIKGSFGQNQNIIQQDEPQTQFRQVTSYLTKEERFSNLNQNQNFDQNNNNTQEKIQGNLDQIKEESSRGNITSQIIRQSNNSYLQSQRGANQSISIGETKNSGIQQQFQQNQNQNENQQLFQLRSEQRKDSYKIQAKQSPLKQSGFQIQEQKKSLQSQQNPGQQDVFVKQPSQNNLYTNFYNNNINNDHNSSNYQFNANQKWYQNSFLTKKQIVDKNITIQEIRNTLNQKDQFFTDSEFPPTAENIGGDYNYATWRRINEVYQNPQLFLHDQDIDATDLQQGNLGNGYFLAALTALVEYDQQIVYDLFQFNDQIEEKGLYSASLCWVGKWEKVIVDNYFPMTGKNPSFSRSRKNLVWVMIIEKIWAKLHGSYCQIDAGLSKELLHDLTGAPSRTFFINPSDRNSYIDCWNRIRFAQEQQYIITASSLKKNGDTDLGFGVCANQCFVILQSMETQIDGQLVRILRLRNSWNINNWKQISGENDPFLKSVPEKLKEQLEYNGRNNQDGLFLIEYNDFVNLFESIQICYAQKNALSTGIRFQGSNQGTCFKVNIEEPGIYQFQVHQRSIRCAPFEIQDNLSPSNFYNKLSLIICPENNPRQCIIAVQGNQRDLASFRLIDDIQTIQAGVYYVYVEVEKSAYNSQECGFSVYGLRKVEIQQVENATLGTFAQESSQTCKNVLIEKY